MNYSRNSRIKDVYEHPVGRDVVNKLLLQMNVKRQVVNNPVVRSLRLSTLERMLGAKVNPKFWEAVLALLNADVGDRGLVSPQSENVPVWWKEVVFYQIYPKSFKDSDADGIGDIKGIIEKLDYLKDLGIGGIWLCPIYDSPQDDNGYDIRDYQQIDKTYGAMEDFDLLLSEVHKRDMRLIMDLVVNHTSDEHEWFQQALSQPDSPYRSYYHIKKGEGEQPPNNWTSFFSGSAWKKLADQDWALRLFSSKQMDLNWDNPILREEIYRMVRWWLEKGVDGFRLDVINYISKEPGLPQGDVFIGELMGFTGIEHYFHGPKLHSYLRELRTKAFAPYNGFTVGETPGIGLETGKLMTAPKRGELDMIFSFDHLESPGKVRFDEYQYDPVYLKEYYTEWMENYSRFSTMSLFYDNHDNPRMLSKIDPKGLYRDVLAKLLAVLQLTLKGTPFLYQGQEIGAVNADFQNMNEMKDVESLNLYKELIQTMSEEAAFQKILGGTRDHARVPMKWDDSPNGGFTTGTPWIRSFPDDHHVKAQLLDPNSVLHFYQTLISLRKENREFIYGDFTASKTAKELFVYERGNAFRILLNLSTKTKNVPKRMIVGSLLLSNYKTSGAALQPYEARIYKL